MDFIAVDVLNDADGMKRLLAFGVRNVPVIARGDRYIFAQSFDAIAEFVGIHGSDHAPLPPDQLIVKWLHVLRTVQRYVAQMPDAALDERVIPNRDRPIRFLGHHVFRIGEAFLETVVDGAPYTPLFANVAPDPIEFPTGAAIARYGRSVTDRLEAWWTDLSEQDRACSRTVPTFFGDHPVHLLLERSTWHSAQHARQLAAVLERLGIVPDGLLSATDLAGLPLPERLWE